MAGKQLSEDRRSILGRLFQIPKLDNREIAFILNINERTVRRRRDEFNATGQVHKHKDVSKNAMKLKPGDLEKLIEWHKDHPDALLDDMQLFLQKCRGVDVSPATVSRQLKKAYGKYMRSGRCARLRSRKERAAEGRSIAMEIEQSIIQSNSGGQEEVSDGLAFDQRQLAPIQEVLAPQHDVSAQHYQVS